MSQQLDIKEGLLHRKRCLEKAKRVVVKVGSAVLTMGTGLNQTVMENLVEEISFLRQNGVEVILVSSGAVAAGRQKLGLTNPVLSLREKQAAAAVGQADLIRFYEKLFEQRGIKVAQVLLTHDDLSHRDRYLNVRNTMSTLFDWGILPILNENDTVSVKELRFGDNDTLGAIMTKLSDADGFFCLTDVDGLYTGNPCTNPEARPVHTVIEVDKEVEGMAGNICNTNLGTGGMRSKIIAAKMVAAGGGFSFIGSGRQQSIFKQLYDGETVGTFFLPHQEIMGSRKHWIAYTLRPKGKLLLDSGACRALIKNGKSLLPSGILEVCGEFGVGEPIQCCNADGVPIATGLVNYSSLEISKIQGVQTSEIEEIIGYKDSDEVIHRDNLVLI